MLIHAIYNAKHKTVALHYCLNAFCIYWFYHIHIINISLPISVRKVANIAFCIIKCNVLYFHFFPYYCTMEVNTMVFRIQPDKKESENKTIRFPLDLIKRIEKAIASSQKEVSFSSFVIQACIYALDNIEDDSNNIGLK